MMLDEINRRTNPFPSAVYAATQTSGTLRNTGGRGLLACINITNVPTTDTVQLIVDALINGQWIVLGQTAALATTGVRTILIYPGAGTAASGITVSVSFPVPEYYRVRVVHSTTTNFTYSVTVEHLL